MELEWNNASGIGKTELSWNRKGILKVSCNRKTGK